MIGSTNLQRTNIRIRKKKIEYLSSVTRTLFILGGNRENNTLDPSSGGSGIILKTAKTIFIRIT
jgi:hypothetical protein